MNVKLLKALTAVLLSAIICGCSDPATVHHITTEGTRLIKNGKPYRYIGCNIWYASILGSTGMGGDRERLCHELDQLKDLGITNVRILSFRDGFSLL